MLRAARTADDLLARSRVLWLWLGQAGVVILGVHLAADRLDDQLAAALWAAPWSWPGADWPLVIGAWGAVALELAVVVKIVDSLLLTARAPSLSWRAWWAARSADALVLPVFWGVCAAAGAWSVGMAVEDRLAALNADAAFVAGVAVALGAGWRLGWTGWRRVVGGLVPPRRRTRGLVWALALAPLAVTAALDGLPIWGWLP